MQEGYGNEEWRALKDVPRTHLLNKISGSTILEREVLGKLEDDYVDVNERKLKTKLINEVVKATGIDRTTAAERVRKYTEKKIKKSRLFQQKTPAFTDEQEEMIASIMLQTGCSRKLVLERLRKYKVKKDCDRLWEPLNEKYRRRDVV